MGARARDHAVIGRAGKNGQPAGVPRWPAAAALLAVGAFYAAVSGGLTLGPSALVLVALVSVTVAGSAVLLIGASLGGGTPAPARLGDAALIWAMKIVTFAV